MDVLSPRLATLLAQRSYTRSAEIISIPTDALCILADALGITPSPDTLLGLAISAHTFTHWQHARGLRLTTRCWQHTWGLRLHANLSIHLAPGVGNTLGGCALHAVNLSSPLHC
jgi:hypothetical protein